MAAPKSNEFDPRLQTLARLAKALSHPARIAILETLAERASCVCGEIVEVLPLAQSTVSQHLKELQEAELISGEVSGLKSCYCLNRQAVQELEQLLGELFKNLSKSLKTNKCC